MKSGTRVSRLWIAVLSSIVVGAALLLAWQLTRDRWPAGTVFVPQDAPSLAAALERVDSNGTIALDARRGPFAGRVSVDVPGVSIRSRNGRALVESSSGTAITVTADGITIEGLALKGSGIGISVSGSNCKVLRASMEAFQVGIEIISGTGNAVEDTTIRGGQVGVDLLASGAALHHVTCADLSKVGVRARDVSACALEDVAVNLCPTGVSLETCKDVRLSNVRVYRAETALDVAGGSGTDVVDCVFSASRVGVRLQATESASIEGSGFDTLTDAGIVLAETMRTRVVGSTFRGCLTGLRESGAGENTFSDNTFSDCQQAAIVLQGGKGDLVSGNRVHGGDIGISLDRTTGVQLLRNHVERALLVGLLLDRVDHAQLLDNVVVACPTGIAAVASSSVAIRRSEVRDATSAGIAFLNGTLGNTAAENHVVGGGQGILLAGSSRDSVVENDVSVCEVGVALQRLGFGTRVEGNDVASCGVGLAWDDAALADDAPLLRLGFRVERGQSATAPIVVENAFRACREADIMNRTAIPLLAGGNHWSAAARVEGRVSVPDLGWMATVALGSGASTADLVLGRLLQWMLAEGGIRVVDLIGLGSEEDMARAFDRGDLNAAWWSADAPLGSGAVFWAVPARKGWAVVVSAAVAAKAASGRPSVSVAVPEGVTPDLARRTLERDGLSVRSVQTASSSAAAESLLKFGTVDCAILDRLEETVTLAGYIALDDAPILPLTQIGLRVESGGGDVDAAVRATFDRLQLHLTDETLRNLVSRVRLLGRDPLDVAMEYLLREGLIGDSAERGA
jgi:nitrous oxidase accessory protein NosD